jgi:hypothetical protein
VEKREKGRGVTGKCPSSSPRFRNGGGRPVISADGDWWRPGVGDGRGQGENEEGVEGYLSLPSPWSGTARVDGSSASGGGRQWWLRWWCLEARESRGIRLWQCEARWEAAQGLLWAREGGSGEEKYPPGDQRRRGRGVVGSGRIPAWTSVGEAPCGAVL